jgi:hypothetical protein
LESDRCAECIRLGRSDCDLFGLSRPQLLKIADRHSSLESQLEAAEEEAELARHQAELAISRADARVRRLRKEKRFWFKRLSQAVSRGLESVEELEALEHCEEEEKRSSEAAAAAVPSAAASTSAEPSVGKSFILYSIFLSLIHSP